MISTARGLDIERSISRNGSATDAGADAVTAAALVPNDIGRLGRPEEIAAAVLYLAGPFADDVSGATIRVDGGTIRSVH